jgi:hypothetical protein
MVGILGSALSRTGPGPDYYYSLSSDSLKMSHYLFFPKKGANFAPTISRAIRSRLPLAGRVLRKQDLQPGTEIKVEGYLAKDGGHRANGRQPE